jgi:hypothetical protein
MAQVQFNLTFGIKRWFFDREIVKRIKGPQGTEVKLVLKKAKL